MRTIRSWAPAFRSAGIPPSSAGHIPGGRCLCVPEIHGNMRGLESVTAVTGGTCVCGAVEEDHRY